MGLIGISKVLSQPNVIEAFSYDTPNKENIPMATYQLGKTVKNKLLNYKETVNSIFLDKKVAFSLKIATFKSEHS